MTTYNFEDALESVNVHIPTAPEFVVIPAFNRAVRRFCAESGAYRAMVTNINVTAGTQECTYTVPTNTITNHIESMVYVDTVKQISPATEQFVIDQLGTTIYEQGEPRFYIHSFGEKFKLYPTPETTVANGIRIEVSLVPTVNATSMDSDFINRYLEHLAYGAASEIAKTPQSEFYNPDLVGIFESYFRDCIYKAKQEAKGNDRNVPRRVRYGGIRSGKTFASKYKRGSFSV